MIVFDFIWRAGKTANVLRFQPALALSVPDIAGVAGDGLLTMEEIFALKLDADLSGFN